MGRMSKAAIEAEKARLVANQKQRDYRAKKKREREQAKHNEKVVKALPHVKDGPLAPPAKTSQSINNMGFFQRLWSLITG